MRKVIIIFILLGLSQFADGQSNIEWVQRDSGTTVTGITNPPPIPPTILQPTSNIKSDDLGNIYVLGYTDVYNNTNDIIFCKYSKNGDIIWRTIYDNNGKDDKASKFCVDNNRNVFVGIVSQEGLFGAYEHLILKLDSLGNIVWTKSLSNINFYYGLDFLELGIDSDNNGYYGITTRYESSRRMAAVLKLNENGDSIWYKDVASDTTLDYWSKSMIIDRKGNSFITGGIKTGPYPSFLTKIDSSGSLSWFDTLQIPPISDGISLYTDTINSISVLLSINSGNIGKFGIAKYDLQGNSIFRIISDSTKDYMKKITYDIDGNILIGGDYYFQTGIRGLKVHKYNSSGNLLWRFAHYPGRTGFSDAVVDDFGNYLLGSSVQTDTNFQLSLYAIKPNGTLQNSATYIGPVYTISPYPETGGFHFCSSILAVGDNIFMNGYTIGRSRHYDLVTIGFNQLTNVNAISSSIPTFFHLHQNYPNPFNPSTKIKFDIPEGSLVKLKIYDMLGREVAELVNEKLNAGVYEYEWNGIGGGVSLPSGVYFYRLQAGEFTETKRMVLVK